MLKISVISDSEHALALQLEGKITGPWVEELRKLSDEALSQQKSLTLDLQRVWFVDAQGIALLHSLAQNKVSQVNCSRFVIQQLTEAPQC